MWPVLRWFAPLSLEESPLFEGMLCVAYRDLFLSAPNFGSFYYRKVDWGLSAVHSFARSPRDAKVHDRLSASEKEVPASSHSAAQFRLI